MCELDAFVGGMKTLIGETDFAKDCGDGELRDGKMAFW
jgi:hypothetical protein